MRTHAEDTNAGVIVVCASGHIDWPVLYSDGAIGYDRPEAVPQFVRPKVRQLLEQRAHNDNEKRRAEAARATFAGQRLGGRSP